MASCMHCSFENPEMALRCERCERSLFWSHDPLIGKSLGNFRILHKIGQGGCGSIYLAEHPVIGRKYAVKILHTSHQDDPEMLGRFRREAQLLSDLEHENILHFYDFGEISPEQCYIVTEYLSGETLQQRLKRGQPISLGLLRKLIEELCPVLDFVHQRGVIHRDIKPSNIFLHRERGADVVKLIDFGIAGSRRSKELLTRRGEVLGTASYCAPEQAAGRPHIDGRADLYGLGIVVFRCLTGQLPFRGSSPLALYEQHIHAPAPSLAQMAPQRRWAAPLEAFLRQALAKRPEDRPQSGEAFRRLCLAALEAQERCGVDGLPTAVPSGEGRAPGPEQALLTPLGFSPSEFLGIPTQEQRTTCDRPALPEEEAGWSPPLDPFLGPQQETIQTPELPSMQPSMQPLMAAPTIADGTWVAPRRVAVATCPQPSGAPLGPHLREICLAPALATSPAEPLLLVELAEPLAPSDDELPSPQPRRRVVPWLVLALGVICALLPLAV